MTPLVCRVRSLQKLRQNVAGASAMFGRDGVVFVSTFPALVVEGTSLWTLVAKGIDVGVRNVRERREENGEEWFGEEAQCGDGLVRSRCRSVVVVVFVVVIVLAMWNWNNVLVSMRTREQEELDPRLSFIVDLMENWPSGGACFLRVRTRISSTKVMPNADHENTTDLVMERYVTDLCFPGNDVTVSSSSAILKCANAGPARQRTALQKEALVDAASLQKETRRSIFFMLIRESRVAQDRLDHSNIYSATFKEQKVFDAQSLRFVDLSATSDQPDVLLHRQSYLYRGPNDTLSQSVMLLSLILWRSIWTLWRYCLLQSICCSFSISVNEACTYNSCISEESSFCKLLHCWCRFRDLKSVCSRVTPLSSRSTRSSQFGSSTRWSIHPRIDDFYIVSMQCSPRYGSIT